MYAYASYPVNSHANELGTSILWFIFLDYSQLIDSLAFKLRVQITHCLWIFKVMPLLKGDTNPFHPQCVKFQPLPVLFNPPWLGMQQSALSAEQLHLQNLGLQAAAAYLALTSESMELHQDLWKENLIAASTQAGCVGAAAAGTMHSSHQHHGSCGHKGACGTCWL